MTGSNILDAGIDKKKTDIDKTDIERSDKERFDKERSDKERSDKERSDKERSDKERSDIERFDIERPDIKRADIKRADIERSDIEGSDIERPDIGRSDIEKEDIEKADLREVLDLAMNMGRVLLKNGAEIFRVEETIVHVCKRYEIMEVDPFVMSNGIFMTARIEDEEVYAKVKHIPISGFHLGIVTEVNDLSREIASGNIGLEEATRRLDQIEAIPPKRGRFRVLAAGIGSGCFCYLLQASIWESLLAVLIGCILYVFVIVAENHRLSKIITNIVGGGFITVMALVAVQMPWPFPVRIDKLIIGSILPLVPGLAFVNSIRDIANSDFISGIVRIVDALLVFVYIAIGVGFVLGCSNNLRGGG